MQNTSTYHHPLDLGRYHFAWEEVPCTYTYLGNPQIKRFVTRKQKINVATLCSEFFAIWSEIFSFGLIRQPLSFWHNDLWAKFFNFSYSLHLAFLSFNPASFYFYSTLKSYFTQFHFPLFLFYLSVLVHSMSILTFC